MATQIVNHPDLRTACYAELWSSVPFALEAQPDRWPQVRIPCEDKGDVREIGARYKFDVGQPAWVVWEGQDSEVRLVKFVAAADTSRLENPPGDQFLPVYPGVNVLEWETVTIPQPEPTPTPMPGPSPGTLLPGKTWRVLVVTEVGRPPLLVRAETGEQISLTVVQRRAEWFDRLNVLLKES